MFTTEQSSQSAFQKKSYKDFPKISIGGSDIASLVLRSPAGVAELKFDEDGDYSAYDCFGDVEIGSHYKKVYSAESWLTIYDDEKLTYKTNHYGKEFPLVDIYRAGAFGCIIHWHN